MILFNVMFAALIAYGVVYNASRIILSERSRDLASLRVLGFTRREVSAILLGELAVIVVCAHARRPRRSARDSARWSCGPPTASCIGSR